MFPRVATEHVGRLVQVHEASAAPLLHPLRARALGDVSGAVLAGVSSREDQEALGDVDDEVDGPGVQLARDVLQNLDAVDHIKARQCLRALAARVDEKVGRQLSRPGVGSRSVVRRSVHRLRLHREHAMARPGDPVSVQPQARAQLKGVNPTHASSFGGLIGKRHNTMRQREVKV